MDYIPYCAVRNFLRPRNEPAFKKACSYEGSSGAGTSVYRKKIRQFNRFFLAACFKGNRENFLYCLAASSYVRIAAL